MPVSPTIAEGLRMDTTTSSHQARQEADELALRLDAVLDRETDLFPEVHLEGHSVEWLIVTPEALFVLHPRSWTGQIRTAPSGTWRQRLDSGQVISHHSLKPAMRRDSNALTKFLQTAFPGLDLPIQHILVLTDPEAKPQAYGATEPPVVTLDQLGVEMESVRRALAREKMEVAVQYALVSALASCTKESQRIAQEPFIFRSGLWAGLGKRAHTVAQAIHHIDRRPDDGIYHLRNGSLERWFTAKGALHLADIAKRALRHRANDRTVVESFLQQTGAVKRPKLVLKPTDPHLGWVCAGESASMLWRIRRGRGRGYLYGEILSRSPWVHVRPTTIDGRLDCTIQVDTANLSIATQPVEGRIELVTNADEAPIQIPVRVYTTPPPSPLEQRFLRPLAAALAGGLVGLPLAWLTQRSGLGLGGLEQLLPVLAQVPVWFIIVMAMWLAAGALRGWNQRPAWPVGYATMHWLVRVIGWAAALAVLAQGVYTLARWLFPVLLPNDTSLVRQQASLIGAALACVPAAYYESLTGRFRGVLGAPSLQRRAQIRTAAWSVAGVAVLVLVVGTARFLWPDLSLPRLAEDARTRAETWLAGHDYSLRSIRDEFLLRLYDRRARPADVGQEGGGGP